MIYTDEKPYSEPDQRPVQAPAGYEYTGEFRKPEPGERFVSNDRGRAMGGPGVFCPLTSRHIIRKALPLLQEKSVTFRSFEVKGVVLTEYEARQLLRELELAL